MSFDYYYQQNGIHHEGNINRFSTVSAYDDENTHRNESEICLGLSK